MNLLFLLLFSFSVEAQNKEVPWASRELVKYEQDYNDRIENLKEFVSILQNDIDPRYLPEKNPVFKLNAVWVPNDQLEIISTLADTSKEFKRKTLNGDETIFFFHPESASFFKPYLEKYPVDLTYLATPLASHRSIVAWKNGDSETFFLKVSLNRTVGGSLRLLNREQIERAAAISNLFHQVDQKRWAGAGIHFIDEPFHVLLKKINAGYSLRSMPALKSHEDVIPLFALYSKRKGRSLLSREIQRSHLPAKDYLRTYILQPLISHSVMMAFEEGLIGELHEQNVMVLTRRGRLTKDFYYRDAAGFSVDPQLRAAAGKDMSFFPEKFDIKNLRTERAHFLNNSFSYLLDSNFYAMRAAVVDEYPEITQAWMKKTFIQILSAEIYQRTGLRAETRRGLESNWGKYIKRQKVGSCPSIF